jgi:hypothetical protein
LQVVVVVRPVDSSQHQVVQVVDYWVLMVDLAILRLVEREEINLQVVLQAHLPEALPMESLV